MIDRKQTNSQILALISTEAERRNESKMVRGLQKLGRLFFSRTVEEGEDDSANQAVGCGAVSQPPPRARSTPHRRP